MSKNLVRRNTGYKGFAKISTRVNKTFEKQADMIASNPLIGDSFFLDNPSNILGEQSTVSGRFGSDILKVSGSISALDKIDAVPVAIADFFPTQEFASVSKQEAIDRFVNKEQELANVKRIDKIRDKQAKKKGQTGAIDAQAISDHKSQEFYTTREVGAIYNKNISKDELDAYFFTHPELNYKLLFDEYTNTKQDLIDKGLICYEDGKWVYYFSFISGNVNKKISALKRDDEKIKAVIGNEQYERQMRMLAESKPKSMGFIGDNKITLLPHSNFSKEMKISELRSAKPELNSETNLTDAFMQWLRVQPPDSFKLSNYREVIDYYILNKSIPIDKQASKEVQARQEKNAINIRQRTKEEGDLLFGQFLSDELLPEDQAKIAYLWNEKFNSIVEPDLEKIPICLEISKTFKTGVPFMLNPTQRRGVAFSQEKKSGLFAYGVGVGKTAASIGCFSQAYTSNLAHKGIFVVPTNTYDKWIGEIHGYVDKESGKYMHGLMPQLPAVIGLYNLNPQIVKEKIKLYNAKEEKILMSLVEAIELVKDAEELTADKRAEISEVYPVNWKGLTMQHDQLTMLNFSSGSASKTKPFEQFVANFLRDEYNYNIYSLGEIRPFPNGTIFVTTEVGLQRLGVSPANQDKLTERLFAILSQGEATGEASERDIAGLQLRIDQTVSSSLKNAKLNIEDFGIDWCCFDESHYYKKLFTYVKGAIVGEREDKDGNVKYKREKSKYELKSGQYPSARALSAFVLSHFIQSNNDNRNVIQLTATPFTNSPLEVFSMLTLTNYKQLEEMGLSNMTDFFDTFMKINYDIKYTPQKTVVKDVVLTGYNNLSQLRSIIYSMMDKKDEGANLIRPTKIIMPSIERGVETTIPMNAEQNELMKQVKDYIQGKSSQSDSICKSALQDEIENLDFDSLDDQTLISEWERATEKEFSGETENLSDSKRNDLIKGIKGARMKGVELDESELSEDESAGVRVLRGLAMMRQITLSPYLYYKACRKAEKMANVLPDFKDYIETSPKLKYVMGCVQSVIQYHRDRSEKISGQVIYMNAGVEYFPLIKEYAVKKFGLKESQVGMVTGGMSKSAKETVKMRFLSGDIIVLIGSSTIAVGVDLQNNSSTLYNCYYDWNPTDAAQIEGRIWRQGNRFAYVRINYPQCYNSADPILFEYLNSKTLRINEIWNRSSGVQELDLRDFNPKELQKKLITDPEEKANWEILEESDKIESQVIYFENRTEMLTNAMSSFREVKNKRASVVKILNEMAAIKSKVARRDAVQNYNDKIADITEKYATDPDKMVIELQKYKSSRYDHINDPDGKYTAVDYTDAANRTIYVDCFKYIELLENMSYRDSKDWGDLAYNAYRTAETLKNFRYEFKDMVAAEEKVLKPMGLTFETALNPVTDFQERLTELKEQLEHIEGSFDERVARITVEMAATADQRKTVEERVAEFAADNEKYLSKYLSISAPNIITESKLTESNQVVPDTPPVDAAGVLVVLPEPVTDTLDTQLDVPQTADSEPNLAEKVNEADELTADVIQNQIDGLTLILKYKKLNERKIVQRQIDALNLALENLFEDDNEPAVIIADSVGELV